MYAKATYCRDIQLQFSQYSVIFLFSLTFCLHKIMFKSILTMLFDKYSDLQDQVDRTYCSRRLLSFSLYNALKLNAPYVSDLFISHN